MNGVDEAASAAAGVTLEDLSWIAEGQVLGVRGPRVPRGALDMLAAASRTGRLSRADAASPAAEILRAQDLVDARGRLTTAGERVVVHFSAGSTLFDIESRGAGTSGRLTLWRGPDSVLLAGSAAAGGTELEVGVVTLWTVPFARTPAAVAAWLGLAPEWTFGDEPFALPRQTVQARIDDPAVPVPDGAGPHLAEAWAQPWIAFDLRTTRGLLPLIHAGAGWLRRHPERDRDELTAIPPAQLFASIERLFLEASS